MLGNRNDAASPRLALRDACVAVSLEINIKGPGNGQRLEEKEFRSHTCLDQTGPILSNVVWSGEDKEMDQPMAEASSAFAQTLKTVYGFSVLESAFRYVDISLRLSGDIPRANRIRQRLVCYFAESRYGDEVGA